MIAQPLRLRSLSLAYLLVVVVAAGGAPAWAREPRIGQAGIASAHPLATAAGQEMLAAGGNAFDAAVAVSAALSVVEPQASGLGGGAFFLLHDARRGRDVLVDARETAPAAATRDMYLDAAGNQKPGATVTGPLAAGIPGLPAGLVHLAKRYGKLPLAKSLAPAIRYAEQGVPVTRGMELGLRFRTADGAKSPAFAALYYPAGKAVTAQDTVRQPDLAATLRRFAAGGFDGYYRGETAQRLVAGVQAAGGIWSSTDLADYRVIERQPIRAQVQGITVTSAPPPSAGGIALVNALNILAGYDLPRLEPVVQKHLVIEALRRVFRDRVLLLGDPAFVEMPVERLLSPWYAEGQRVSIRLDRATPSDALAGVEPLSAGGPSTTHFSILDRDGNRVAGTQSINTWFGSAFVPPGTGVLLNNEMDDFTVKVGASNGFELVGSGANAIAPGKRMLSSMSPTFLDGERGMAILGTPGGSRIISMVLLSTLAWMEGGDADRMVSLPRYHHQYYPDAVSYEAGAFTEAEVAALKSRGHRLEASSRQYGNMQVVTWDRRTGKVTAASDPRGGGEVLVY